VPLLRITTFVNQLALLNILQKKEKQKNNKHPDNRIIKLNETHRIETKHSEEPVACSH